MSETNSMNRVVQNPDRFGCVGNTIKVAAGHYVDLENPTPESIDIETIASALSKMCRFGCQCPKFYSVAEHCVHATSLAATDNVGATALKAVFLHDAAEAYIGDVVKPLKVMLPDYAIVEDRMEAAIKRRFGVDFKRWHDLIKEYDRAMLKCEKTTMWPDDAEHWVGFSEIGNRNVRLQFWGPDEAERQFLKMAKILNEKGER